MVNCGGRPGGCYSPCSETAAALGNRFGCCKWLLLSVPLAAGKKNKATEESPSAQLPTFSPAQRQPHLRNGRYISTLMQSYLGRAGPSVYAVLEATTVLIGKGVHRLPLLSQVPGTPIKIEGTEQGAKPTPRESGASATLGFCLGSLEFPTALSFKIPAIFTSEHQSLVEHDAAFLPL